MTALVSIIGSATAVLGATAGTVLTARKGRDDLRSQIQKDARDWIKDQSARIDALEADLEAEQKFSSLVRGYLLADSDWHHLVMGLLAAHGLEPPVPPPVPPTRTAAS